VNSLNVCHRCQWRERACRGGCRCLFDKLDHDIIEKATVHGCPLGLFQGAPLPDAPPSRPPSDVRFSSKGGPINEIRLDGGGGRKRKCCGG
jgi:hypothetical protein